jgi:tetratricopeptide (TPR) repeat protein
VPNLLDILACPKCHASLDIKAPVIDPGEQTKSAILVCAACAQTVGAIRNYKYDFLYFDRQAAEARLESATAATLDHYVCDRAIRHDHPSIRRQGAWELWDGKFLLGQGYPGDQLSFTGEFSDIGVRLLHHPWSGIAELALDGHLIREVDLYQPEWPEIKWHCVANDLSPGPHTLAITVTGRKHPEALAAQVLLHEIVATGACTAEELAESRRQNVNRVLPYFDRVQELMRLAPTDGRILDCGGGDRMLDDPRFVNAEYMHCQLPHVYADSLELPFRDASFDLVISQAVLDHVKDPFRAVSEMQRVTKPGGTIWAGMAFMQPVHAVPSHYFNATAWGLEELFKGMAVKNLTWFGNISFTVDWMLRAAGVQRKMPAAQYRELMARIKEADQYVSQSDLRSVASGVAIEVSKSDGLTAALERIAGHLARGGADEIEAAISLVPLLPREGGEQRARVTKAIYDVALAAEQLPNFERCIQLFEQVLSHPDDPRNSHAGAWFRIGINNERLGRWKDALAAFRKSLMLVQDWPHLTAHAHHHIADLLSASEEHREAAQHYQALLSMVPEDLPESSVLLGMARCAIRLDKAGEARESLEKVRSLDPQGSNGMEANRLLAQLYEADHQWKAARQCYENILSNPHCSDAIGSATRTRLLALSGR